MVDSMTCDSWDWLPVWLPLPMLLLSLLLALPLHCLGSNIRFSLIDRDQDMFWIYVYLRSMIRMRLDSTQQLTRVLSLVVGSIGKHTKTHTLSHREIAIQTDGGAHVQSHT